ncbi:glutaminase [Schinkia azotoformans]|nr:glutaminase [Schinkia azotoformans]MEC1748192.1 glutaminase [Schinkia azotoformans]MEC1760670.1 glutaminase [Schinkia azotoformans]MED4377715.1 glutaminase [Schinkia azotoformans]
MTSNVVKSYFGVYSPGIDDIGNSVAGMKLIEKLS